LKRHFALSFLILILVAPTIAVAKSPSQNDGFQTLNSVDIWTEPNVRYSGINFTFLLGSSTIYIDITVTSGDDITIYLLDGPNHDSWIVGAQCQVSLNSGYVTSYSTEFDVPRAGRWHVVFYNDGPDSVHIEGWVGSFPESTLYFVGIIILGLIGAIIIVIIIRKVLWSRKPQKQPYPSKEHMPAEKTPAYCPYCGTSVHPRDAIYCPRCGKSLT
jgi:hypothetical protein